MNEYTKIDRENLAWKGKLVTMKRSITLIRFKGCPLNGRIMNEILDNVSRDFPAIPLEEWSFSFHFFESKINSFREGDDLFISISEQSRTINIPIQRESIWGPFEQDIVFKKRE